MQSFSTELNKINWRSFSKIKLGTAEVKNINKIYDVYNISKDEVIVATVKKSIFGFGFDGVVITDQAIYFHPNRNNRYPYTDICSYIAYQEDTKSSLELINEFDSFSAVDSTLISQNNGGSEMGEFIDNIQSILMEKYDWARQQRQNLAKSAVEQATTAMYDEDFPKSTKRILKKLRQDKFSCNQTVITEGKRIFIFEGENMYMAFLENLPEYVLPQVKKELIEKKKIYREEIVNFIYDVDNTISNNMLKRLLSSIETWKDDLAKAACGKCYALIRLGNKEQLEAELEKSKNILKSDELNSLETYRGCYLNHSMIEVYRCIKKGETPTGDMLTRRDSFGFTPLHYALFLRNYNMFSELFEGKKWNCFDVYDKSLGGDRLLDYKMIVAVLDSSKKPIMMKIVQETTDVIKSQLKAIKYYNLGIKAKKAGIFVNEKQTETAHRLISECIKRGRRSEAEEYRRELQKFKENVQRLKIDINDIQSEIYEIEKEIDSILHSYVDDLIRESDKIKESKNPYTKFLLSIVKNPDLLLELISLPLDACKNYTYKGKTFTASVDLDIDFESITEDEYEDNQTQSTNTDNNNNNNEQVSKPYGSSWFSPEAHSDIKKLGLEYRVLAKKYHPDASHMNTSTIFIDITNERADILEILCTE